MAKLYCQVAGILLLVLGVVGVLGLILVGSTGFPIPDLLSVNEPAEIVVHFVTGALATYAGFSGGGYGGGYGRLAVLYAQVFGIVYVLLAVIGFIQQDLPLGIHFDLGCNLAHLILGLWGIYAGFFARAPGAAPAT